jgi:N-dimethylarginine dimethylaminohydrolase
MPGGPTERKLEEAYEEQEEFWPALDSQMEQDLPLFWGGKWGCASECGPLRAVLLRRPGAEIENMADPRHWRFSAAMDPALARAQHDATAQAYRAAGVTVHYIEEMRVDRPNALFVRDNVFMTPEGAILARQAMDVRRGEEMYVAMALARLGVPILRTISGRGVFEGACAMWVDEETVILGSGNRANAEGCAQVREVLQGLKVRHFIDFPIPYGHAHIDGFINILDRDLALIFPWQVPHQVWQALRDRGFQVLTCPSLEELKFGSATNFVAVGPRRIIAVKGNPKTKSLLESAGVEVTEVDVSELRKGRGAIHCMTAFLAREW